MTRLGLHYFRYECGNCGQIYKSPVLAVGYGDFLMKSRAGNMAYLLAYRDLVFAEISTMLKKHSSTKCLDDNTRANILHNIFGLACDKSPDGTDYQIRYKPICPFCNKCQITHWGPTDHPPEYVTLEVEDITHDHWNGLTQEEKSKLFDAAVREEVSKIKKIKKISWINRFIRGTKKFFSPF